MQIITQRTLAKDKASQKLQSQQFREQIQQRDAQAQPTTPRNLKTKQSSLNLVKVNDQYHVLVGGKR
jgi:mRNA-degrading endonuclease HigB of HigAB toxin-antitoxin module